MNYTEEDKRQALLNNDLSKLTNMLSDKVDINSLVIPKRTDVLLVALIKQNKGLFNSVLLSGFPSLNNKNFRYIHHAIRTKDIYFVRSLISHYQKMGIDINEVEANKTCLDIALEENNMPQSIISYLQRIF